MTAELDADLDRARVVADLSRLLRDDQVLTDAPALESYARDNAE